ncbi:MAG: hypothetical protein DRO63_05515, partial [Candidatus Gerdarchaeota archaeon]
MIEISIHTSSTKIKQRDLIILRVIIIAEILLLKYPLICVVSSCVKKLPPPRKPIKKVLQKNLLLLRLLRPI